MNFVELFLIAAGLSMDAFAVSICKGLAAGSCDLKSAVTVGLWFGGFQAIMPIAGYFTGVQFKDAFSAIGHWVAFILLCVIGWNMAAGSFKADCRREAGNDSLDIKTMFAAAVATSIDAFAAGVTFAFLQVKIMPASLLIGAVTFIISAAGMKTGSIFGARYKNKAQLAGGVILILLGIKILVKHISV